MAYDGSLTFDTAVDTKGFNTGTKQLNKLATSAKVAITAAIAAGVTALVKFASSAVDTGKAFDSAMSQVAATMGTTSDSIDTLRNKAKEMGSTTAFTATEAAEGLNILAMAGYNATEQCAMIESVLNLASAGATTLDNSASYLTTTLKGYCVTSEETGIMTEYYSDLMAKGATLVNTSVDELGTAMAGSAATANAYGQTVETTTTALLALADGGITGSQAANYLSRMMTQLYAPTTNASNAMKELSDKTGVAVTAYDEATGESRDFMEVLGDLTTAFSMCTEEEKNHYANTILGQVGLKGYNTIATKTSDQLDEMTANLTDCDGAAKQMADTQLDNLEGDMTLLSSAVDGVKISFYEMFEGTLRGGVQFVTNTVIPAIQAILDHLPQVIAVLGGVAAAVTTYMIATNAETIAIYAMEAAETIATVATKLFSAALNNIPLVAAVAAIGAAVTVLITLCQKFKDTTSQAAQLKAELEDLEDEIDETNESFEDQKKENDNTINSYRSMAEELANLTSRTDLTRAEQERLNHICEEFQNAGLDVAYDSATDSLNMSTDAINDFCDAMEEQLTYNTAVEEYNALMDEQAELLAICSDCEIIMSGETDATNQQIKKASNTYEDAQEQLEALNAEIDECSAVIDQMGKAMEDTADTTSDTERAIQNDIDQMITDIAALDTSYDEAYDAAKESLEGQFDLWEQVGDVTKTSVEDIMAGLASQEKYYADYADNIENLTSRQIDGLDELVEAYCDGSVESAGYIASMASMSDEQLEEMIAEMNKVTEQQDRLASGAAEASTGYTEAVTEMVDRVVDKYDDLDVYDEVVEYTEGAMNGICSTIENEEGEVEICVVELSDNARSIVSDGFGMMADDVGEATEDIFVSVDSMTGSCVQSINDMTDSTTESVIAMTDTCTESFDTIEESCEESFESMATLTEETQAEIEADVNALSDTILELTTSYEEVYNAAYESMSGQFDLWDEAAEVSTTSMQDLQSALDSQQAYWEQLSDNIELLSNSGIDGMDQLLASVDTTTTEGVNYVASLAAGLGDSSFDMQAYVDQATQGLSGSWESAASSVADSTASYESSIEEAMEQCINDIEELDQGTEAHEYAVQTLQGYINGLSEDGGEVSDEIVNIATELCEQFANELGTHSPSTVFEGYGEDTTAGYVNGLDGMSSEVSSKLEETTSAVEEWGSSISTAAEADTSQLVSSVETNFSQIPNKVQTEINSALNAVKTWSTNLQNTVKTCCTNVTNNVQTYFAQVPTKIQTYTTTAGNTIKTWSTNLQNTVKTCCTNIVNNVSTYFSQVASKIQTYTNTAYNTVNTWCSNMLNAVKNCGTSIASDITSSFSTVASTIKSQLNTALNSVTSWNSSVTSAINSACNSVVSSVSSYFNQIPSKISSALDSAVSTINGYNSTMSSAGHSLGENLIQGIINGVNGKSGSLYSTVTSVVNTAVSKANSAAGVASPSKKTIWTGEMIDEGFAVGLNKYSGLVEDAMEDVVSIIDAANDVDYNALMSVDEDDMRRLVSRMQAAVNRETDESFSGFRIGSQRRAETGYGENVTYDQHTEQVNNYYDPVVSPSIVSRNQREALRNYVGGAA